MSIDRGMDKEDVVQMYMEYYSAIRKNEMPFATQMHLEIIILSEVIQKKTNTIWYYLWNLRYDMNKLIYKTETRSQTQNRLVAASGGGVGGKDWEFGMSRCKLFYEKQHTCVCVCARTCV